MTTITVTLPTLHADQVRAFRLKEDARGDAWAANAGGRFKAVRCGRRWGKTELGKTWIGDGAIKQFPMGWFAPDYKKLGEAYEELVVLLDPVVTRSNKNEGVIRLLGGGRIDFWTLLDESAGRSRKYKRVFIDEAAFAKPNMMNIWKKSIKPSLFDYAGSALVASNTNGVATDNFMWQICNQAEHGFIEYHAPTINNPTIPLFKEDGSRFASEEERTVARVAEIERLRGTEHPLVFLQEYEAGFVDWRGVAFFSLDKLLVNGAGIAEPTSCDYVFATIDTATKTGTKNDGTGVTFWARNRWTGQPLVVLDWDITQIQGDLLEVWLAEVFKTLDHLALKHKARRGSLGAFIEDKSSGMVLIMASQRKALPATAIPSVLTSVGKDERAISVSGYVHREEVKMTQAAHDKVTAYKGATQNHFEAQVCGFRIGVENQADDLLDTFTYGVAIALGDAEGI